VSDLREALDDLQGDMAAHQRRHIGEVTASANQSLAASAFERLERERAEAKPVSTPEPVGSLPIETKTERREGEHGAYTVKTEADKPMLRTATKAEGEFFAKAMPRIELLLTKLETGPLGQPSWHQRVLAVMSHKSKVAGARMSGLHDYADALDRRFLLELLALLDDSSRLFGDWRADDAPTKVTVSG
jgi:hypothetical protein